jgi:signal transduction histidine kinase
MDWVSELRQGFRALPAGAVLSVSFADRSDTIGEVGREFNALAAELGRMPPNEMSRERAHALRNRLAGILAALHVLNATGALDPAQQAALQETVEEAKRLDAALRAHPAAKS